MKIESLPEFQALQSKCVVYGNSPTVEQHAELMDLAGKVLDAYRYPHQGTDKRVLGRFGAWICSKLSWDSATLPRPLFVVYVAPPGFKAYWGLWMLRAGWHYDYNAKAYIFGFAFKKASEQSL